LLLVGSLVLLAFHADLEMARDLSGRSARLAAAHRRSHDGSASVVDAGLGTGGRIHRWA
jgi:hypothetical protein